jgi:hypothetical protein
MHLPGVNFKATITNAQRCITASLSTFPQLFLINKTLFINNYILLRAFRGIVGTRNRRHSYPPGCPCGGDATPSAEGTSYLPQRFTMPVGSQCVLK